MKRIRIAPKHYTLAEENAEIRRRYELAKNQTSPWADLLRLQHIMVMPYEETAIRAGLEDLAAGRYQEMHSVKDILESEETE